MWVRKGGCVSTRTVCLGGTLECPPLAVSSMRTSRYPFSDREGTAKMTSPPYWLPYAPPVVDGFLILSASWDVERMLTALVQDKRNPVRAIRLLEIRREVARPLQSL